MPGVDLWVPEGLLLHAYGRRDNWPNFEDDVCVIIAEEMSGENYSGEHFQLDPVDHITLRTTVGGSLRTGDTSFHSTSAATVVVAAFDWPSRMNRKKQIEEAIAGRIKKLLKTDRRVECEFVPEPPDGWVAV